MSLECELTQLKVLHECIRGISCELALWIHKTVFIPKPIHSFKKQKEVDWVGGLFEVSRYSFFFSPLSSLQAKEDWVSLICSLYIWMSSAKSSSWLLDKGPGAETVAVPNFVSVGAVNHTEKPTLWRSLRLICGHEGKPFSSPAQCSHPTKEDARRRQDS